MTAPSRTLRQHSGLAEKVTLRRRLLQWSAPKVERLGILETHAGNGTLAAQLSYQDAARWLAIDRDKQFTNAINHPSEEVLRSLDLAPFHFFDIDAYGNPLECAWIISQRRRPTSPIALALTSGFLIGAHKANLTYQSAGFSRQMLDALRADPETPFKGVYDEALSMQLFRACIEAWYKDFEVVDFVWQCGFKPNSKALTAYYIGVCLEVRPA